jgi:hypothetical protein
MVRPPASLPARPCRRKSSPSATGHRQVSLGAGVGSISWKKKREKIMLFLDAEKKRIELLLDAEKKILGFFWMQVHILEERAHLSLR